MPLQSYILVEVADNVFISSDNYVTFLRWNIVTNPGPTPLDEEISQCGEISY
jgi:hypothetical protein